MPEFLDVDVDAAPVRAAFASLGRRLRDLRAAWAQVGARMEDAAHPLVPVESGALVDSLRAQAENDGVAYGSYLIYAGVQDRGWPAHGIEGHHFTSAAADAADRDAVDLLSPAMQRQIDLVGLG